MAPREGKRPKAGVLLSSGHPGRGEENGVVLPVFVIHRGGPKVDFLESRFLQPCLNVFPRESPVVNPGRIVVEAAVLLIEVSESDTAARVELLDEALEQGWHIRDVMQGHAADDEIIGAAKIPTASGIQGPQAD